MEKTISPNQTSLILAIFTVALKLSALPALMFVYSGNDSYITCFIALAFDFLGTILIIQAMKKVPEGKSFFELIKETLSKPVAIILYVIMFAYFFVKCIISIQELHDYFIATLFEELNPILFIIIISLSIVFVLYKDFRTIGRVIELCFWPMVIGLSFTLIFPMTDLQIEKLLPVFEQGFSPILKGLSRTTFAFGDYMILLILMGKITINKKSGKKILLYMSSFLGFILNFFVIFVASFGNFGINQSLALGELPLHNSSPATIGKLEWLTIIIWTTILLINSELLALCCKECFVKIFGCNGKKLPAVITTLMITITITSTYLQLQKILKLVTTPAWATASGIIQVLLIITLWIAILIKNKKENITKNNSQKEVMRC